MAARKSNTQRELEVLKEKLSNLQIAVVEVLDHLSGKHFHTMTVNLSKSLTLEKNGKEAEAEALRKKITDFKNRTSKESLKKLLQSAYDQSF